MFAHLAPACHHAEEMGQEKTLLLREQKAFCEILEDQL